VYNFTVIMGLVDFIPVILFGFSMVLLLQDLHSRMSKMAFTLFSAGMVNIFIAGFLKALWKTLYAAGICDFHVLNTVFLPLQSLGFLMAGIGLILALSRKKSAAMAVAPPVVSGTFAFIGMMVAGLGAICACLSVLAVKMKKKGLVAVFALAFVVYMGMGYMSSQDSTSAVVNWIEQGINCAGQIILLAGVYSLHKAGLAEFDWRK